MPYQNIIRFILVLSEIVFSDLALQQLLRTHKLLRETLLHCPLCGQHRSARNSFKTTCIRMSVVQSAGVLPFFKLKSVILKLTQVSYQRNLVLYFVIHCSNFHIFYVFKYCHGNLYTDTNSKYGTGDSLPVDVSGSLL